MLERDFLWRAFRLLLPGGILLACLGACTVITTPEELTPVTVQLRLSHQAQFAGFYAADLLGYYQDQGLDVTLEEGMPQNNMEPVLEGTADFGIAGTDELILQRSYGRPFTAIATIYRSSPIVFVSLKENGISRPDYFAGKKIRVTEDLIPTLYALTAKVNLTPEDFTIVTEEMTVDDFINGEADIWAGYLNGSVAEIQDTGLDLNIVYPDDYGVHFYAGSIYAREDYLAANPDLTLRFLRATLKGWDYAVYNTSEVGEMIKHYNPQADVALENKRMVAVLPLMNIEKGIIGWMQPDIWADMVTTLQERQVLTRPLNVENVYTLEYLQQIYP